MSIVSVNTNAAVYTTRRDQFRTIVQFWGPILKQYFRQRPAVQEAWREQDPFLDDLLRFVDRVNEEDEEITDV